MHETVVPPSPKANHRLRKAVAFFGTGLLIALAIEWSPDTTTPRPVGVVEASAAKSFAAAPRAVDAANAFLDALDAKQRERALLEFDSNKKPNWSNLPVTFVPRNGLKLGELTKPQQEKALAVVASVLSKEGYQKVIDIMDGDQKLLDNPGKGGGAPKGGAKGKGGNGPMFGKDLYYLAIFGTPSDSKPWMVQFGGHHLGVNVTVIGKQFILTPTHTGSQPAVFKRGDMEVRPLAKENDAAFKLIESLNDKQKAVAIIGERPTGELLLGPGRDGKKIEPKGIKGSALTKDQQAQLMEVIAAWVSIVESEAATERLAAIKTKIDDTYFAWSGPTEKGKAAYFRVQGPTIVIEYAPQGGTDHIHTVIRNPEDDYGLGQIKK